MTYSFNGYNYLVKLEKGERLHENVIAFAHAAKLQSAWVSGIGGALTATLGYYDLDAKTYIWKDFDDLREVVSLSGNIAFNEDGAMQLHAHGVLSDRSFKTVGGHIKDLVTGATLELFIHPSYKPMRRKADPEVGLQTLDL